MTKTTIIKTEEIQRYLNDIRKIPVITHKRQDEIFSILNDKNITKIERKKLLDELVKGNLRFVFTIAKSYQNQGMDFMDIINEGNYGLIKAAQRFNPTSGVKFISYAVWWVRQTIMASLNDNARTIRLPSNLVQDAQKQKKGEITDENIYHVNVNDEQFGVNLPYCVGLYQEINDDGDQLIDLIPNREVESPDACPSSPEEMKKKVTSILSILNERERTIIERCYGLLGVESNLDDLGVEFGCTKERIRQIRDLSIRKLRNNSFNLLKYLD